MSKDSLYLNKIDHQLSKIAENDQAFKHELAAIYSEYMRNIPLKFAKIIEQKDHKALTQLHHKHKTTCYVLSLQELSEVFIEARDVLISLSEGQRSGTTLNKYIDKVNAICGDTMTQLQAINQS